MIVQCPNCQAKFGLPDEKIGPAGAKLRCGKCRHVFHVDPPQTAEAPQPAPPAAPKEPPRPKTPPAPAAPDDAFGDFDFPDDLTPPPSAKKPPAEEPEPPAPPKPAAPDVDAFSMDDEGPSDVFHSESYEPPLAPTQKSKAKAKEEDPFVDEQTDGPTRPGFSLDDVADIPLPGSSASKDRRRRVLIIGVAMLMLLGATLAAVHFLDLWPGKKAAKDAGQPQPPAATAPAPASPDAAQPPAASGAPSAEETAKVKDIMLQNVRQYYVSNEKAGQLFVIEGKAVNNFKVPKEMVKLEASLFDEKGSTLASQQELAGNTVSLFQLQVMTRDELKNALTSQVGVLTNNTNIASGNEVPFMLVFFDPPEAVKEFGVKVVDAKDPPKQ